MNGTVAFSFLVGTLTTLNPCGFVLLPAYFTRRLEVDGALPTTQVEAVSRALKVGGVTTFGIVLVFVLVGAAITFGAYWLNDALPWTGFTIGIFLMLAGLWVIAGKRLPMRVKVPRILRADTASGLGGDLGYGIGYGIISLSCMLPIFLTVTSVALSGSLTTRVFDFIAFALGVGTILTGLSVSAAFARNGLATVLKRFLPYTYRVSGALLFFAGFYITYLWGSAIFQFAGPGLSMLAAGEIFSGALRTWLSLPVVQWSLLAVLGVLIVTYVWVLVRKQAAKQPERQAQER